MKRPRDRKEVSAGNLDVLSLVQRRTNSKNREEMQMAKKFLVFLAMLTLVVSVACKKEETHIDTGTDTVVTETSATAGTTDVTTDTSMMTTDTMATDTMATDTSATSGTPTDTTGTTVTTETSGTVSTTTT